MSFLSLSLANKYLAITLALTNVNFRSVVTWSMFSPLILEPAGGGVGWSKSSRGVNILDFSFLSYALE